MTIRRAVNPLEVAALYARGKGGRYLSYAGMARELRVSLATLRHHLTALRAAGLLDDAARARMRERAGRTLRGRQAARISYDQDELMALRGAGLGPAGILAAAQSLPRRATIAHVRRIVRELDAITREKVLGSALERAQPKAAEGGGGLRISTKRRGRARGERASTTCSGEGGELGAEASTKGSSPAPGARVGSTRVR